MRSGNPFIHWASYVELCKPRVVTLMLLTAIVGMYLASPGVVPIPVLFFATLGIGLLASAAATVNHLVDRKIDALMARTQRRPIASGKIPIKNASLFASILGVLGLFILIEFVNLLTATLTFLTLLGYAVIYTLFLKRATPQNIVIGGVAGAAPPLLGWTAVTNSLDPHSFLLVLIIFAWTPPHFWSLAIYRFQDYAKAEIPMLPVTHGIAYTKLNIFLYTCLLFACSLLPFATGMSGLIYLSGAIILGVGFLYQAIRLWWSQEPKLAMQTFHYSVAYLMLLFVFLLVDHAFLI